MADMNLKKKRTEMQLRVGELATRAGMTVRTLHYYEEIGLLTPSARTDAGYRLYNRDDIARLHAIQALGQIGLPLNEIGVLLKDRQEPLPTIIQRQITALERQIEQASELCERLRLLKSATAEGRDPDMAEWLSMLSSMSAYGKYFTASELKRIFDSWKLTEDKWLPLIAEIRAAMESRIAPESLEIQPLARRWMDLSVRWMNGDFELMKRWEKMYLQEPVTQGRVGVDREMVHYINQAIDLRVAALLRYFSQDELQCLNTELEDEWILLAGQIKRFVQKNTRLTNKKVREVAENWNELVDRTVRHDPVMRRKFLRAYESDSLLQAGSFLDAESGRYIRAAWKFVTA